MLTLCIVSYRHLQHCAGSGIGWTDRRRHSREPCAQVVRSRKRNGTSFDVSVCVVIAPHQGAGSVRITACTLLTSMNERMQAAAVTRRRVCVKSRRRLHAKMAARFGARRSSATDYQTTNRCCLSKRRAAFKTPLIHDPTACSRYRGRASEWSDSNNE